MAKISREELLKLARISQIAVHEDEVDTMITQLDNVLSYAERVNEVVCESNAVPHKAVNRWRDDLVIPTNPEPIIAVAPEHEAHYFVVPKILDNN
jgi:aspartyl-tRNA(Asn)/glutamyl-tRNA(Gln) amidotransferase subunit C